MVYRWIFHPGQSRGCWGRQKGGSQEPPDHALGRSRGGFSSKLHVVTDGQGVPLAAEVTPGQQHEATRFVPLMNAFRVGRRCRPQRLAGDKGYSYPRIRRWLRWHSIQAVIPQRSDQLAQHSGRPLNFDKTIYRRRSVIERCIGWLKECRRIGTRFEKLALNFLAMIKLAIIRRYFRVLDLSETT
jgi:transposase